MMVWVKKTVSVVVWIGIQVMAATLPVNAQEFNILSPAQAQAMANNLNYLDEAREDIKKYETANPQDPLAPPYWLRKASNALIDGYNTFVKVTPATKDYAAARVQARNSTLLVWLQILVILDRDIDPHFDPKHAPEVSRNIMPPEYSRSQALSMALHPSPPYIVYYPDMDPKDLADPQERAEYEKAIAKNRAAANYDAVQFSFWAINGGTLIPKIAEDFILKAYTNSPEDKRTLRDAIEKNITNPQRKTELLNLLPLLHGAFPGAQSKTGEPCPETGTWRMQFPRDYLTPPNGYVIRQYVLKGTPMPALTTITTPAPGLRGHYIGSEFHAGQDVTWKLESYARDQDA